MAPELKLELGGKFGNFVLLNTIALRNHKPDRCSGHGLTLQTLNLISGYRGSNFTFNVILLQLQGYLLHFSR